eukprot:scaffold879_cov95-Skeletonema_dohrnii-CCMP3373.AAC.1
MEQNYCPNLPTVWRPYCGCILWSFTVAIVVRRNAYLSIWTDFMPSYISLDDAVIPGSITIAED